MSIPPPATTESGDRDHIPIENTFVWGGGVYKAARGLIARDITIFIIQPKFFSLYQILVKKQKHNLYLNHNNTYLFESNYAQILCAKFMQYVSQNMQKNIQFPFVKLDMVFVICVFSTTLCIKYYWREKRGGYRGIRNYWSKILVLLAIGRFIIDSLT